MTDTYQRERTDARLRGGSLTINPKFGGTRGHTLVELMVVMCIMALLVSFGVPRFVHSLEQARVDMAATNLRAIWTAQRLYWLDNRTYTTTLSVPVSQNLLDPSIRQTRTILTSYPRLIRQLSPPRRNA